MKKTLCMVLVVVLLGCAFAFAEGTGLLGGWAAAADPAVTEEARAAFDKAMEELVGVNYEPVALLGTQVVAGTNYCLLCKGTTVTLEPRTFYALIYINAAPDGEAQILEIQQIELGLAPAVDEPVEAPEDAE